MAEHFLFNKTLFNKIKLKKQKHQELEKMCDDTIRFVENTEEDMLFYFKLSNGIINKNSKSLGSQSKRNMFTKRTFKYNSIYVPKKETSSNFTTKPSSQLYLTTIDQKESKTTEESSNKLTYVPNSSRKITIKKSKIALPHIGRTNSKVDFKDPEQDGGTNGPKLKALSSIKETIRTTDRDNNLSVFRSEQRLGTKKFTKRFVKTTLNSPERSLDSTQTLVSPITPKTRLKVNPIELLEKLEEDFKKVPAQNVKKRFSKIYNEFESINHSNIQLNNNIEKSHKEYIRGMNQLQYQDKIEQHKLFDDDLHRERLFVMDETKKDPFVKKLDKYQVLKEYKFINVIRDEHAKDVMRKYMKNEGVRSDSDIKRIKNHEKVLKVLDKMQWVKYQ
jgi:hypothetical protein